jgi:hypothetical protein
LPELSSAHGGNIAYPFGAKALNLREVVALKRRWRGGRGYRLPGIVR